MGQSEQRPTPAGRAPKREADDLELDFPELGTEGDTSAGDDEAWEPGDESDFELRDDEGEPVGLDTSTGLDDDADLELDADGEGERWTADSEDADDLPDADGDVLAGAEYGWIGDDDADGDDDEAFDPGIDDDAIDAVDDGGAEGVEDDTDLADFDVTKLPQLDADSPDEGEPLGGDSLDELAEVALADEPLLDLGQGVVWRVLPERSVRVRRVKDHGRPAPEPASAARSAPLLADLERMGVSSPSLPVVVVDEDGEDCLYACLPHDEQVLVVRAPTRGTASPSIVCALARSELGGVISLQGSHAEGLVSLVLHGEQASYSIDASLDGGSLA